MLTNDDGIAVFSQLRIIRGVPGAIKLEFFFLWCSGDDPTRPDCAIPLFRNVTLMVSLLPSVITLRPLRYAGDFILTGESFSNETAPLVKVSDGAGNPVQNVSVVAFVISNVSAIDVGRPDYANQSINYIVIGSDPKLASDDPKYAYLTNQVQMTDLNGVASFQNLRVQGANSRSHLLGFYAWGVFAVWNNMEIDPAGNILVHEFTLVEPEDAGELGQGGYTLYPLRAVPRDAGQNDPWGTRGISVEGEYIGDMSVTIGNPVGSSVSRQLNVREGKRAIAVAVPYSHPSYDEELLQAVGSGLAPQAILNTRRWRQFKVIENAISAPSNAHGVANFTDVRFSIGGAEGLYRIRFFVNGNEDPDLFLWEVQSSLARVEFNASYEVQLAYATQGYLGCVATDPVFGCVGQGYVLYPPSKSVCAAQDAEVLAMKLQAYVPIQQQTANMMLQAADGAAYATDPTIPCWPLVVLSQPASGQYVVYLFNARGQGLEGKDASLYVRPDADHTRPAKSAYSLPSNPRVGIRSSWKELGGGAYVVDLESDVRVLWVQPPSCYNCSNAPFEYTFGIEGKTPTLLAGGGVHFHRFALLNDGTGNKSVAEDACGPDTEYPAFLSVQLPASNGTNGSAAQNASTIRIPLGTGLCADVIINEPLPASLVVGQPADTQLAVRVINATGHGLYGREVCLGWDDSGLVDSYSTMLAQLKAMNPLTRDFDDSDLRSCGVNVDCVRTVVVERSDGLCNVTEMDGSAVIGEVTLPYPAQLLRWLAFVRDPGIGYLGHPPTSVRGRCLQERLLLPYCQSDWYWSFVYPDVSTVRYVGLSSLNDEGLISPVPYPIPPYYVPDGSIAQAIFYEELISYDPYTTATGVQGRLTAAEVQSSPGFQPARQNDNMSLPVAVGTVTATPTSLLDLICISGDGCDPYRKLTDPGFGRLQVATSPGFLGTYYIRHDIDRAAIRVIAWPVGLFDTYPDYTRAGSAVLARDPMYGQLSLNTDSGGSILSVGSAFPFICAVNLSRPNGSPASRYRVRAAVEVARADGRWEETGAVLLRNQWSLPADANGVAACQQGFGVDWVDGALGTRPVIRLVFGIYVGSQRVLQTAASAPFVVSCPSRSLAARWVVPPNSRMIAGEHVPADQLPSLDVTLAPDWSAGAVNVVLWRPPPLEVVLVDADEGTVLGPSATPARPAIRCRLLAATQLSGRGIYVPHFVLSFDEAVLSSCVTGAYILSIRARLDWALPYALPLAAAQFEDSSANLSAPVPLLASPVPLRVSSHGVVELEVVTQPPTIVETLLPFNVSVRLLGQGLAPISDTPVVCAIDDDPAWPAAYAAFDAGGRIGQLTPVRNATAATGADGVANFMLTLVRGDPTTPLTLTFSSYFAETRTRPFRLRHHFRSLVIVSNVSADPDKAALYTVPLGTITLDPSKPRNPRTNETTQALRLQGVLVSTDPSLDTFTLDGPVIAVYDHAGLMVQGLGQVPVLPFLKTHPNHYHERRIPTLAQTHAHTCIQEIMQAQNISMKFLHIQYQRIVTQTRVYTHTNISQKCMS